MNLRAATMLVVLFLFSGTALAQVSTIAVVSDGPSPSDPGARVEAGLREVLPSGASAVFLRDPAFDIGWDPSRASAAIRAALADPDVDIVLVTGFLGMEAAMGLDLTKPVLSAFATRMDAFNLADMENDRSTKENLSFTLIPQRIESDIAAFRELRSFATAHVLLGEEYLEGLDAVSGELEMIEQSLGVRFSFLGAGPDPEALFSALPQGVEAVLLSVTPRLSAQERAAYIAGFTQRGIPTYSLTGYPDVEAGAMAARTPDVSEQVVRRTAVNLSEVIRGRALDELPVILSVKTGLYINGPTSAAVDYFPSMETIAFARFLDGRALTLDREPLAMTRAMEMAEQGNAELAVSTKKADASRYEKDVAKSGMFPQIRFNPAYTANPNALGGLEGLIPEQAVSLGLSLRQMIWDDRTVSDYKSASRYWEGRQMARESDRLEALGAAAVAYLQVAQARVLFRILQDNLRLTEENLDLARLRVAVGYSGRDEVFRWEAELAKGRSEMFSGLTEIELSNVALNRILGVEQDRRWLVDEPDLDEEGFPLLDGRVDFLMDDTRSWNAFRGAMVEFGTSNSPELAALGLTGDARNIQLSQRKRRWWLPSFVLEAGYQYQVWRDPELDSPQSIPFVQVKADYPILEGGGRQAEIRRMRSEVEKNEEQTTLVHQIVEQRVRGSIRQMESSYPSIRFNRIQAENAGLNLDLVQEKYSQGLVNVIVLMDAQNTNLQAEQSHASAVFTFLTDLIQFQRAISWFEAEQTPAGKDEFFRVVQDALAAQ